MIREGISKRGYEKRIIEPGTTWRIGNELWSASGRANGRLMSC